MTITQLLRRPWSWERSQLRPQVPLERVLAPSNDEVGSNITPDARAS